MERVPFSGSAVLKGVRTCADPRKLRLGQSHIVCMALDSGCTALSAPWTWLELAPVNTTSFVYMITNLATTVSF